MFCSRASWDSLSSLKARPRWKTVHLESYGSCFLVVDWSIYTLTYLYLTEFFRSVSLTAMRGRDSLRKKVKKVSFLSLVALGGFELRHVLLEAKIREEKKITMYL